LCVYELIGGYVVNNTIMTPKRWRKWHAIKPGPYKDTTSSFPRMEPSSFLFLFLFW